MDPVMEDFMEALLNLHNLMANKLPNTPPKTYQHRWHKIDHIFGTIGVLTTMTRAGIVPFGEGPKSNHHAIIYADLSLETLCGLSSQSLLDPTHQSAWNLWSMDIKVMEVYVTMVQNGFTNKNILEHIAILTTQCNRIDQCTMEDERILNNIDKTITKILLDAEGKCKHVKGHVWPSLLANAGHAIIASSMDASMHHSGTEQRQSSKQREK